MNLLECPHCRGGLVHAPELAGQLSTCPHCGNQFTMPVMGVAAPQPVAQVSVPEPVLPAATANPVALPAAQPPPAQRPPRRKRNNKKAQAWIIAGSTIGVLAIVVTIVLVVIFGRGGELNVADGDDTPGVHPSRENNPKFKGDVPKAKALFNRKYAGRIPDNIRWSIKPIYVAIYRTVSYEDDGLRVEGITYAEVHTRAEALREGQRRKDPGETIQLQGMYRIGTLVIAMWDFEEEESNPRTGVESIRVARRGYSIINGRFRQGRLSEVKSKGYVNKRRILKES